MAVKSGRIGLIVAIVFVVLAIATLPGFFYRNYQLGTGHAYREVITSENITEQKFNSLTEKHWNSYRAAAKAEGLKCAFIMVLGQHIPLFIFILITVGLFTRSISRKFRTFLHKAFFANWIVGMLFLSFGIGYWQSIKFPESLGPAFIIYSVVVAFFGTVIGIAKLCRRRGSKPSKLRVNCPQCDRLLNGATTDMIGDTGVCPKCKAEFVIEQKDGPKGDSRRWTRQMMDLDLDNQNTWDPFRQLVYARDQWRKITQCIDDEPDFMDQLTCSPESLRNDVARDLRTAGLKILLNSYENVVGYHGCRRNKESTYCTDGILPSDTSGLIEYARQLFHGISGFDEAVREIRSNPFDYLKHNEGKIGLFLSAKLANHFSRGSELISAIINRLGAEAKIEAKRRYVATGKPTVIKCLVPIEWLDTHTTYPIRDAYFGEVLYRLIRSRRRHDDETFGSDFGYLLTRAIPPENILEFIDMTQFVDYGGENQRATEGKLGTVTY